MSRIKVGEVFIAEEQDFEFFKKTCKTNEGWKQVYFKGDTTICMKDTGNTSFKMARLTSILHNTNAPTLYDVLHDCIYRKIWDKGMIEGREICTINANNDIGYYALQAIPPFQNRDFVTQRSWTVTDMEYIIFNHSVCHKKAPPRKSFVRATSFLTGYMIRPISETSCHFTYLAQCDPRGYLPAWLMNQVTQFVAPRMMQRLVKAADGYQTWKAANNPDYKPWFKREQLKLERIDWSDVETVPDFVPPIDESNMEEDEDALQRYMNTIGGASGEVAGAGV